VFSIFNKRHIVEYLTEDRLYKYLVIQNMTQKQLASRYDLSPQTISNLVKKYSLNINQERKKYIEELKQKRNNEAYSINTYGLRGFNTTKRYGNNDY